MEKLHIPRCGGQPVNPFVRQEKIWLAVQELEPQKARQEAENQGQGIDSWSKNFGTSGFPGSPRLMVQRITLIHKS